MMMYLVEIGQHLKQLRKASHLTQEELAQLAGVARETVSRIENGTYNDLGVKKLVTLLALVGGEMVVVPKTKGPSPDFVRRAVISANVSHKDRLHADELIQALITGTVPPGKAGHLQTVLEELSEESREGLISQIEMLSPRGAKVRRSTERLRERLAAK